MNGAPLEGIRACVFDAYGTLFDYASAAAACRDDLGDESDRLTALWRDKQLQYTWLRAAQGRHADFWQVTGDALDFTFATLGIDNDALHQRLMNLYLSLPPFPEVPDVLRRLKQAGLQTAILSNGSPRMLQAAVENANFETLFDHVLSVESEASNLARKSISWRSRVLAWTRAQSASNLRTRGTPMRPRRSECAWSGAIATVSDARVCQEHLT